MVPSPRLSCPLLSSPLLSHLVLRCIAQSVGEARVSPLALPARLVAVAAAASISRSLSSLLFSSLSFHFLNLYSQLNHSLPFLILGSVMCFAAGHVAVKSAVSLWRCVVV